MVFLVSLRSPRTRPKLEGLSRGGGETQFRALQTPVLESPATRSNQMRGCSSTNLRIAFGLEIVIGLVFPHLLRFLYKEVVM